MNEQIDSEAVINDLLDQLRQANLQIALLRATLRKLEIERQSVA